MALAFEHQCSFTTIFIVFCLIQITVSNTLSDDSDHPTTFIVHMEKLQKPLLFTSQRHWYNSVIKSLPHSRHPSRLLYTYEKVANGFAASFTRFQAAKLEEIPGVLSVMPDETHELHITHTYNFLGLSATSGLWPTSNYGEDIIIGVLDTGIWPEHRSFSDEGLSPVPSTWKGICETSSDFPASSCNRKLIGARAFLSGYNMSNLVGSTSNLSAPITKSPRDTAGHGTHTTSTAAGAAVSNASFYEYAKGEAIGVASKARIAVYKVCATSKSCNTVDILAAIDQAAADGVNIISMSLSGGTRPYHQDNIAIASFGAMRHGILVSVSAGNNGPTRSTVNHRAPWLLTVGASSIDREFRADVILGDNRTFLGASLYPGPFFPFTDRYELVYAGDFGNSFCKVGQFSNPDQLSGKIIVCDKGDISDIDKAHAVTNVTGRGTIIVNDKKYGEELRAEQHYSNKPATRVGITDGKEIKSYIKSSKNPTANILFRGTIVGSTPPAPKLASFTSRGPNPLTPQILKPDITAPGLNILAGWTKATGPRGDNDHRRVEFNVISGTSMACPHVSGIAALLKNANPSWSPAAIKSALMTTAYSLDNSGQKLQDLATGKKSTPFVHGSGHVDPNRALDPGLIYDMHVTDYVGFLCSIGYSSKLISLFFTEKISPTICDETYDKLGAKVKPGDLNLPSFSVVFNKEVETVKYRRSVTNVGNNVDAVYKVTGVQPAGIKITISPKTLVFNANNMTQTYEISFSSIGGHGKAARFGWIQWSDGTHIVKSTIAFSWLRKTTDYVVSI